MASLTLPPGSYVLSTKLRYQGLNSAGNPAQSAGCVYQSGSGNIGGLDASVQDDVPAAGQVDGSMMDIFHNYTTGSVEVHVQCMGPSTVGIVNPQFSATPATLHIQ